MKGDRDTIVVCDPQNLTFSHCFGFGSPPARPTEISERRNLSFSHYFGVVSPLARPAERVKGFKIRVLRTCACLYKPFQLSNFKSGISSSIQSAGFFHATPGTSEQRNLVFSHCPRIHTIDASRFGNLQNLCFSHCFSVRPVRRTPTPFNSTQNLTARPLTTGHRPLPCLGG